MKQKYPDAFVSGIIQMAWADEVSFESIQKDQGLSEAEVIKIMRDNLKPGSFRVWRKRVSGRMAKHENRARLIDIRLD